MSSNTAHGEKWKRGLALLAAAGLATALAACGSPAAQQGASPPASDPAPATQPGEAPRPTADPQGEGLPAPRPATSTLAQPQPGDLTVFAAAALTDAFTEIGAVFEAQNPGTRVVFNFAASSQLATQIVEGAPADVFASANERQMGVVVGAGHIAGPTATFATNRMAILVPADNPAHIGGLADLANPGVRLVLGAPDTPVRDYANQVFEKFATDPAYGIQYLDALTANLVSEEANARQVMAKVALGEADAGIAYTSDVTPDVADKVLQIAIPDEYNVTATYPIGITAHALHPDAARAFIELVLSDEGQAILIRWGFGAAPGE